jgi:hypothetical protein
MLLPGRCVPSIGSHGKALTPSKRVEGSRSDDDSRRQHDQCLETSAIQRKIRDEVAVNHRAHAQTAVLPVTLHAG